MLEKVFLEISNNTFNRPKHISLNKDEEIENDSRSSRCSLGKILFILEDSQGKDLSLSKFLKSYNLLNRDKIKLFREECYGSDADTNSKVQLSDLL